MSQTAGRRRTRWIVLSAILLLVVAWGAVVSIRVWSAYHHDQRGLAELQSVRAHLDPGTVTASATQESLGRASAEFGAAHGELTGPLMAPATWVPVLGRQLRSVQSLSSAAQQVAEIGSTFLGSVHGVLDSSHGAGPERVASLRRLSVLSLSATHQLATIDTGPDQALVGPLARKHDEFVTQLDDARDRLAKAAAVSAVTATILQGPQTYLVLAGNNAEMRAGSGSFLEVGTADTSGGEVHLGQFGPSGQLILAPGQVTVTGDLQRNWGWLEPGTDFRNLGLTPQFDVTAPLAAEMWAARTGQQVDGVLAVDVVALRQILTATGPVQADGVTVDAGTVEQYLLHDQYAGLTDDSAGTARSDALGAIAQAVLRQLQDQTTDLRSLASAVSGAVAGRHLMVWSAAPAAQAAWTVSGASGALTAQSLAVSVINQGGNKLDQYLQVSTSVATRPTGSHTQVTLTTTLANHTPDGQSQFIAGPYPGLSLAYGDYAGLVADNLPPGASAISMTGAGPLVAKGAEGPTWLVAAPVLVHQGGTVTVNVRFTLPTAHGSMTIMPSARVPPATWTYQGTTSTDAQSRTISW